MMFNKVSCRFGHSHSPGVGENLWGLYLHPDSTPVQDPTYLHYLEATFQWCDPPPPPETP